VAGQRRLAISRLRVPNLDCPVTTAAGNLFSIGTPRHRRDPEIVRSQDTNQQKQRGKNLGEKNLEKTKRTRLSARSQSTRKTYIFESFTFLFFEDILISKKLPFRVVLHTGHSGRNMIDFVLFLVCWLKKTYVLECPPGICKRTFWNHLHFNIFRAFISQESHVFEWPVTQGHSDRNMILLLFSYHIDTKTYSRECPVRVDSQSPDRESQILMVLSRLALAICLPSGLHATDSTLYLSEVNTLINRNKEENLKKTY